MPKSYRRCKDRQNAHFRPNPCPEWRKDTLLRIRDHSGWVKTAENRIENVFKAREMIWVDNMLGLRLFALIYFE